MDSLQKTFIKGYRNRLLTCSFWYISFRIRKKWKKINKACINTTVQIKLPERGKISHTRSPPRDFIFTSFSSILPIILLIPTARLSSMILLSIIIIISLPYPHAFTSSIILVLSPLTPSIIPIIPGTPRPRTSRTSRRSSRTLWLKSEIMNILTTYKLQALWLINNNNDFRNYYSDDEKISISIVTAKMFLPHLIIIKIVYWFFYNSKWKYIKKRGSMHDVYKATKMPKRTHKKNSNHIPQRD